jgi:hypothetical protein
MALALALAHVMIGGMLGPPAHADDPLTLQWSAPASCPADDAVRGEIDELLGAPGETPRPRAIAALTVVELDTGYRLEVEVEVDGETSARTIEGETCADLAKAAAFIVATAIDPRLVAGSPARDQDPETVPNAVPETSPEPEPEPESEPESEPEPVSSPPDPKPHASGTTDPARADPRALRFGGALEAGVGFGPLPAVGAVVGLQLALLGRRFRVEALAHYWTPSRATSPADPDVEAIAQAWELGARGCGVLSRAIVEVPLCGGVAAGAIHAEGQGALVETARTRAAWVRALAGPAVRVRVTDRLWLGARVEGFVVLASGRFVTEPSGTEVFGPRRGGITGTVGIELRLP